YCCRRHSPRSASCSRAMRSARARRKACAGTGNGMADSAIGRRLDRAWRIVGTGASFAAFGIGGLLLGVLVFPLLQACVRDKDRRRRLARRVGQRSFAAHVELMRILGVLTYEIRGRERLQREGLLVLANHPTLIDVVFLVSLLPDADCVVKWAV